MRTHVAELYPGQSVDTRNRFNNERVVEEFAKFLSQFPFTHFVTLTTFRPCVAEDFKRYHAQWVRILARWSLQPVWWFYAMERGAAGGRLHTHALICGTANLSIHRVQLAWKHGNSLASVYDARRGATYYVCKDLLRNPDDYDLSGSRIRHRRVATANL